MWRTGVFLLVLAISLELSNGDNQKPSNNANLLERLKRSPQPYPPCDQYYPPPPPPPPFWPPLPPPPPYWPPPPPPPPPPPQYWPPPPQPPPPPAQPTHSQYPTSNSNQYPSASIKQCDSCGGSHGEGTAISNAKSETGEAVAIAVAKSGN